MLTYVDSEEQRQANIANSGVGKLGVQLAYIAWGFSGGTGPKPQVDLKDYLPFPEWKPLKTAPELGPTKETKALLTRLLKERRLPPHVYTVLSSPPEGGT